jgi:hypothetical protein
MSDLTSIIALVEGLEISDVEQFAAMFMYQGFSPELVFNHLHEIKKTKNISNSEFQNDIKVLILMGAIMGNYNDNNSNKISPEGKDKGDSLMLKYDLRKGGIGGNKKAVNIPRILSAFPIITSKMTLKCSPREYNGIYSSNSLSNFFKTPVSPSLIPRKLPQEVKTFMLHMCNAYLAEQTMAIRNMSTGLEAYKLQWRFTEISHKSPVPSDEERQQYIKGITFDYSTLSNVVSVINTQHAGTSGALVVPSKAVLLKAGLQFI